MSQFVLPSPAKGGSITPNITYAYTSGDEPHSLAQVINASVCGRGLSHLLLPTATLHCRACRCSGVAFPRPRPPYRRLHHLRVVSRLPAPRQRRLLRPPALAPRLAFPRRHKPCARALQVPTAPLRRCSLRGARLLSVSGSRLFSLAGRSARARSNSLPFALNPPRFPPLATFRLPRPLGGGFLARLRFASLGLVVGVPAPPRL